MDLLESKINSIMLILAPSLPPEGVAEIDSLVKLHGEYGVALELLCSILEECKISVGTSTYSKIIEVFEDMHFTTDQIEYYKTHLIRE